MDPFSEIDPAFLDELISELPALPPEPRQQSGSVNGSSDQDLLEFISKDLLGGEPLWGSQEPQEEPDLGQESSGKTIPKEDASSAPPLPCLAASPTPLNSAPFLASLASSSPSPITIATSDSTSAQAQPYSAALHTAPTSSAPSPSTSGASPDEKACLVCGRPAGKYRHYGGQACHSCRVFFRRTVLSGKNATYRCKLAGRCDIDSKSWQSCQRCRYRKCLEAGMEEAQVAESTASTAKPRKNSKAKAKPPSPGTVAVLRQPEDLCTLEEKVFVRRIHDSGQRMLFVAIFEHFMENAHHLREAVAFMKEAKTMSLETTDLFSRIACARGPAIYRGLSDMAELGVRDQNALFAHNYPVVTFFFQSALYSDHTSAADFIARTERELRAVCREYDHLAGLEQQFAGLSLLDTPAADNKTYPTIVCNVLNHSAWRGSAEGRRRNWQMGAKDAQ